VAIKKGLKGVLWRSPNLLQGLV